MGGRRHIPALDGLRGLAILLVFIFHYGGGSSSSNPVLHAIGVVRVALWVGVPLFFVLSGFLITGILWTSYDSPHWWRGFYIRRALRIFPLYYLSLGIIVLGALFWGDIHLCLARIGIFAGYLQNFPFAATRSELGSPIRADIYWSLAVEEHYYLVWPFLLRIARTRRQGQIFCGVIFVLSLLFRIYGTRVGHEIGFIPSATLSRMGELAIGSWLALAAQGTAEAWNRVLRWAGPVCLMSLGAFVWIAHWSGGPAPVTRSMIIFGIPCAGLFFGGLLCLALRGGSFVERWAETRWLRWLGGISYGVYIYHAMVRPLAVDWSERLVGHSHNLQLGVQFLIAAALTLAAAWLSFRYFESPFLRLKNRISASHYARPPAHAVVD